MKKWVAIILVLVILAFVFADSLYYLAGEWQEKTGRIKSAVHTYSRLIKKYPRSRWVSEAKKAIKRLEKSR
jgi:outer membrane protein assembly factor BamD (BamD/ComL family)